MTAAAPEFTKAINLASPRSRRSAFRHDDFFADKSRMLQDSRPSSSPTSTTTTASGWMAGVEAPPPGWPRPLHREARREGRDTRVDIDTSHFTGNFPPAASLEACVSDGAPDEKTKWTEILPAVSLGASAHHFHAITSRTRGLDASRLHIYPDGGVARLRVYGEPSRPGKERARANCMNCPSPTNGGRIIAYNDAHYVPSGP